MPHASVTPPDITPASSVSVTVTPDGTGGPNKQFNALVEGTVNPAIVWSIDEPAYGTITPWTSEEHTGGFYQYDPAHPGDFTIRATSVADPTASGTALFHANSGV